MHSALQESLLNLALIEDLPYGDLATEAVFPPDHISQAVFKLREDAILSGLSWVSAVFSKIDPMICVTCTQQEGDFAARHTPLLSLEGPTRSILMGERLALNGLQHALGIATYTQKFVAALADTSTYVTHTRKTLPGLRALEIKAVQDGGGRPHRNSLSAGIMLKDNHIKACGSITLAMQKIRKSLGHTSKLEVECDTVEQVREALDNRADIILLDNMTLESIAEAVLLNKAAVSPAIIEVSGGITLATIRAYALTGVDVISTSQLTLSAPAIDVGLDFI
jgi:nicotinate-nucleotide pyrophosphorylase (carboxylating)